MDANFATLFVAVDQDGRFMADSKLEFKVGSITFSGEGSGDWLSTRLDKILAKIPELIAVAPPEDSDTGRDSHDGNKSSHSGASKAKTSQTLASYLKSTSSTSNQVRKFLATATWLHNAENKNRLATKEISEALNSHSQGKLTNAANCLNQNVTKGLCVKDGRTFYVTPDGRASLAK
jgi:hypothetical protein